MIRRLGFESSPIERLQLEFTDEDIRVLEWLRGRTTTLPELVENCIREDLELKLGIQHHIQPEEVRAFCDRLWDATGHVRCCADMTRERGEGR